MGTSPACGAASIVGRPYEPVVPVVSSSVMLLPPITKKPRAHWGAGLPHGSTQLGATGQQDLLSIFGADNGAEPERLSCVVLSGAHSRVVFAAPFCGGGFQPVASSL
jgi:hypothetical protein